MTLDDIFNEQEEKKDAVKPVSSSSLTINDIFGEEKKIQKPVYKSDVERFKEDISRRKENIQQIANREIEGKQSKTSSFFQTSGQILGVATDFIGEAIVTLGQIGKKVFYDPLPETSKEKFRTEFVEPIKKGIIEPTSKKISSGEQKTVEQSLQERDLPSLIAGRVNKYQSFKEKNPETAYNIEAGLNVFDFIDTFAVAPALIKGGIKKGIKEARQEAFEQTQKKVTKEVSDQIKKEAIKLDYSSKKLTKSFLGGMTSKDVDKYKDDLSRVLSFVTDNDKAVISKSKNATDDFINVFQKNRTDIGNVADGLARQVDDVVDVEMYYIGNELEKKFKDRLKSLSTDITKMGDKVANKEALYINNYIKQLKASQNYSASEAFERLKKLNSELSDYYTRKKQPGFTSTKKEKIAIELKSGEADILRNRLYAKIDNALGNNMFSRIRRAQEAFENVNSKVLPKIKQRNKLASLDLNEDSFIRGIDAATKAIKVDQPLTIPRRLVDAGKTFFGLEDTKLNNTIKNVFKNLPTKQGIPIKDLVADITDISLKNLDIIKEERYMSDFLQELWKNQDIKLLPPPSVIIMPEFSDSAYQAMKDVKLTPTEIVNNRIDYQIWVNELNRRPEIKLLTEKATEASKMQGTVANPIIPKAPTTYEKPAAKIGNEDFKRIDKFIQDQEALKVFKGNQNKAYEIAKSKFDTIKENYPVLVETIESHPLHDIINKQSKSGEFAGKLSDKASNLDNLLMERGYDDVEQGREAFEGLKELIYRRQRMEKEMSDIYGNLKEIKAGNKTIIDDYVNPKSTEIEDIDFGT